MKTAIYRLSALILMILVMLNGCAVAPDIETRIESADELAAEHAWKAENLATEAFKLRFYQPSHLDETEQLTIFIEGDGLAWINRRQPSANPTPINSTVLAMAIGHPAPGALYLGRPCQYLEDPSCHSRYWLSSRFSDKVIESMNHAVEQLKKKFHASQLQLVGYSGGAAIAVLLAARRDDITRLVTVAGNLDHSEWSGYHKISPLIDSLNPIEYTDQLFKKRVIQHHLVGSHDSNTTPQLVEKFVRHQQNNNIRLTIIPDFNHHCCWADNWTELWQKVVDINAMDSEP